MNVLEPENKETREIDADGGDNIDADGEDFDHNRRRQRWGRNLTAKRKAQFIHKGRKRTEQEEGGRACCRVRACVRACVRGKGGERGGATCVTAMARAALYGIG
eukprot:6191639-Pleurochrysis_carterae.AAC.2